MENMQKKIQVFLILLSNLFPLYGLFHLGWSPYNTVLVFWSETIFMLFFFELKAIIRLTRGQFIAFALFFMSIPIFIFSSIHLAIATLMFGTSGLSLQWDEMYRLISVGISAISSGIIIMGVRHLFDFVDFIRNREYDTLLSKQNQGGMDTLFMRIFFMQFTVIFGGVISKTTHNPVLGVSLLVLLQTIYGISSFLKSKKS